MKFLKTLTILTISTIFLFSCGNNKSEDKETEVDTTETVLAGEEASYEETKALETPTIVGLTVANEDFSILATAVKSADLVSTLNGEGPFTVFAPTNNAFKKLPEETLNDLLAEENKGKLNSILTYHVISGEFKAADVVKAIQDNYGQFEISTVQGETLTLSLSDDIVKITDARGNSSLVILTDVEASNGVVHAIDTVVLPKK